MKLLELRFLAWGPFTDLNLDLSGADGGLHILHGHNEAGKSSGLRGIRALFFGVPERTTDDFLHDGRKLRIAARLRRSNGQEIAFIRRKGRKGTLLDWSGAAALSEDALAPFLGGVTAELFEALFAMDHRGLRSGGEDLRLGKGDLGETLFAAATGGAHLRRVLAALEGDARALFAPRGQSQDINRAVQQYQEATREARERSLSAALWTEREGTLAKTQGERARVRERIAALRTELGRLSRLCEAMPKLARRRELRKSLEVLGEVVDLPEAFSEERREAERDLREATEAAERARAGLEQLGKELASLPEEVGLLKETARLEEIHRRLGSHEKAVGDRPDLVRRKRQAEDEAQAFLSDLRPGLALDDLSDLRPTLPQRARIQELAEAGHELAVRLEEAQRKLRSIDDELQRAQAECEVLPPPCDAGVLSSVLKAAQAEGHLERETAKVRSQVEDLYEQCKLELSRLGGWPGTIDDLERTPVPGEDLRGRVESELLDVNKEIKALQGRQEENTTRAADVERQLSELRFAGEVPTEGALRSARQARDEIWNLVRRAWRMEEDVTAGARQLSGDRDLVEAFEIAVRQADELADRLRREAARVAQYATLSAESEATRKAAEGIRADLDALTARREEMLERWRVAWEPTRITPREPREMRVWLDRQRQLVDQARKLREQRGHLGQLEEHASEHRFAIMRALARVGNGGNDENLGLAELVGKAQTVLDAVQERERRRRELARKIEDLRSRRADAQEEESAARDNLERWNEDWSREVSKLPVEAGTSRAIAMQTLERLEAIFAKHREADGLRHRIEAIDRDVQEFRRAVGDLVEALDAPDLRDAAPERTAAELHARLGEARATAARRAELAKQKAEKARLLREAEGNSTRATESLAKLCKRARCASPDLLPAAEQRSQDARRCRAEIDALDAQLLERGGGASVEELEREAASVDRDTLAPQIESLGRQVEDLETEEGDLSERIGSLTRELEQLRGAAGAAEAAERGQGVLANIRGAAERYLHLRLAYLLLRRQIERYRTEHQGPILRRASEFFGALTRGSFAALDVEFDEDDRAILVGMRASSQTVRVEGMSDGARDQLYLALRLACVEQAFEHSEPLPLILDDVLVHFDDPRGEVALSVLAGFAAKYQVLLFTHHDHVRSAAVRIAGPRAIVHELGMSGK